MKQAATTVVRNIDEARTRVRQQAVRQILRSTILQYGLDDVIEGLRFVYREDVFSKARHIEAVKHRAGLLDEMVDRLHRVRDEHSHGQVLRLPEKA